MIGLFAVLNVVKMLMEIGKVKTKHKVLIATDGLSVLTALGNDKQKANEPHYDVL